MTKTRTLLHGLLAASLALGVGCTEDVATDTGTDSDAGGTGSDAPRGSDPSSGSDTTPTPMSTGYSGTFSGDGLKLRLAGVGSTYTGTMEFQGKTFPVVAKQESPGLLRGTFDSGGKKYALTAALDGDSMSFVSSNKTYQLRRQVTENVLAQWTLSNETMKRPTLSGFYAGTLEGEPATLELRESGETVTGSLVVGGHRFEVTGTRTVLTAMGRLLDSKSGAAYPFEAATGERGRLQLSLATTDASGERFLIADFEPK